MDINTSQKEHEDDDTTEGSATDSRDTAKLLDFMSKAFGAEELGRVYNEDGTIGHAEAKIGDSIVMAFDAQKQWPATPCFLRLYVADGDVVYQ